MLLLYVQEIDSEDESSNNERDLKSYFIVKVMIAINIYIYVIYRLRGPDEKNCARGLENGPSPKGEGRFQDR